MGVCRIALRLGREPDGSFRPVSASTPTRGGFNGGQTRHVLGRLEVAGIAAAGLLLPSALIDWAFGTDLLSILAQATLAAFACALIVAVWNYQNR